MLGTGKPLTAAAIGTLGEGNDPEVGFLSSDY